jgi:protoporphyrinogen oxidase
MTIYDCVIIGSGPAGLTFATLADKTENILIIEKDKYIGGCHKVNRQKYENEYYFSEHGPRVYISNYHNFKMILNIIGVKFKDLFSKYKLSTVYLLYTDIVKKQIYNFNEIWIITVHFFNFLLDPNYAKNISLEEFMKTNKFSETAFDYTDRYVRIIDGGDISKISLNTYLQIINFQGRCKQATPSGPLALAAAPQTRPNHSRRSLSGPFAPSTYSQTSPTPSPISPQLRLICGLALPNEKIQKSFPAGSLA